MNPEFNLLGMLCLSCLIGVLYVLVPAVAPISPAIILPSPSQPIPLCSLHVLEGWELHSFLQMHNNHQYFCLSITDDNIAAVILITKH